MIQVFFFFLPVDRFDFVAKDAVDNLFFVWASACTAQVELCEKKTTTQNTCVSLLRRLKEPEDAGGSKALH